MIKAELTKKEQKENVFLTLGRLKTAIDQTDLPNGKERAKALLKKISDDVSQMDLDLPIEKRRTF